MLLSYDFYYAKNPNKTSLLAAFYAELFFWKTNATLKLWPQWYMSTPPFENPKRTDTVEF